MNSGVCVGGTRAEVAGRVGNGDAKWPNAHRFALFLSHDIDQIHDREMWRLLGDVNHIRRVLLRREPGNVRLAAKRMRRALLAPSPASRSFETILHIEARYGFRSTFFVLHDRYWARYGPRYRVGNPDLRVISQSIVDSGSEIGVHGSYYGFNDPEAYLVSREAIASALGVHAVGVRNHDLRFSGRETWAAQAEAGFSYDATFGHNHVLGPRDGASRPFWAVMPGPDGQGGLVELPLTVMDGTLFRHCGLEGGEALDAAWRAITPVIEAGGLVTLSWHNNFFNEPEYWDWQWVYEELLSRLQALNPWCATGAEIAGWWRASGAARDASLVVGQ